MQQQTSISSDQNVSYLQLNFDFLLSTDILHCLGEIYHFTEKRLVKIKGYTRTILCRNSGSIFFFAYYGTSSFASGTLLDM